MITPGQTLENPVTGERFTFTDTAASTGGELALRMEEMLAEVVAIARAGRMTRRGLPRNPLELAELARRYDQEAHAPVLSVAVQRLLLAPLLFAARHPRAAVYSRCRATASSASMS